MSAPEPVAPPPAAAPAAGGCSPAQAPADAPLPAPRRTRWLDRATALLLAVALGFAVEAAVPSVLRAAGVALPTAQPPAPDAPRIAVPHPPPEILAQPQQPPSMGDDLDGFQRLPWSDEPDPRLHPDDVPGDDDGESHDESLPFTRQNAQPAVLAVALLLHEQPLDTARTIGVVEAGQKVTLLTNRGDWAIVLYTVGDDQRAGWAKKSEIAVR